jgi:DNA-binding HxlR family transcriptional regulator
VTHEGGTLKLLENGKLTTSFAEDCPGTREVLSLIGDKWSALVVVNLGHQEMRFSDLRRALDGISQRVLTLTLRNLERAGLVARKVGTGSPIRVDYALTPMGESLLPPITSLALWAQEHKDEIKLAYVAYESATRGVVTSG